MSPCAPYCGPNPPMQHMHAARTALLPPPPWPLLYVCRSGDGSAAARPPCTQLAFATHQPEKRGKPDGNTKRVASCEATSDDLPPYFIYLTIAGRSLLHHTFFLSHPQTARASSAHQLLYTMARRGIFLTSVLLLLAAFLAISQV